MKTEKEKMLAGEDYRASDPQLQAERHRIRHLLARLNTMLCPYDACYRAQYEALLAEAFPNAHPSLFIQPPFFCDYGYNLHCEENVFFNFNCTVLDVAPVHIGRNAFIAPGVQIYTAGHDLGHLKRNSGVEYGRAVAIGRDCWIGGSAVICPGVTIGDRCVVAAGAVVTRDVPDDSLVGGNPARIIRKLDR